MNLQSGKTMHFAAYMLQELLWDEGLIKRPDLQQFVFETMHGEHVPKKCEPYHSCYAKLQKQQLFFDGRISNTG